MIGAAAEVPIASPGANVGSDGSLGRIASLGRSPTQGTSPRSTDASGASSPNAIQGAGSGFFRANWQAMLASIEGSDGEDAPATSAEFENAARLAGPANSASTGKGSDRAALAGTPPARTSANLADSTLSADKPTRIQLLAELKSTLSSATAEVNALASTRVSSRTNGAGSAGPDRGSGASVHDKAATASPDSVSGLSLVAAGLSIGSTAQPIQTPVHRSDSAGAVPESSSRESSPAAGSAIPAHSLAVSGRDAQSIIEPATNGHENAIVERSGSGPNVLAPAAEGQSQRVSATEEPNPGPVSTTLNALSSTSSAMDSGLAPVSADTLQSVEAAAASGVSSGRRSGSTTSASSDASARPLQRSQRISDADIATRLGFHGTESAQGNTASSTAGSAAFPLGAPGAGSGPATGSFSGSGTGSSGSTAPASTREAFSALDGDTQAGSVSWLHTGANRAEAGFEDPTLGWVGVRADLGGGSVHASLVPGSAEAAQTLGSHLAGLNEYLAERHPAVATVTVAGHENGGAFPSTHSDTGSESGAQSGPQSSTQQNSAGDSGDGWAPAGANSISHEGKEMARALPSNLASPAANHGAETSGRSSGSHISVMA
jgi:hypothetical protein